MLGERATRELGVDLVQLRALATRSVARELGPVPAAEVLTGINVHPLLATGIVIERAGGLAFGLPAIAQWLAAQALLLDEVDVAALLRAPEDLELWRYPVALATCPG